MDRAAYDCLQNDQTLEEHTMLTPNEIKKITTSVPECKKGYYQQTFGTAMGSPVSVVVADLVMEDVEERALPLITLYLCFEKGM